MTESVIAAFVPLVDCAVLVAAREQGFAAAADLDLVLVKEPSWASLRDHLWLGHVDCAHALAPLPVALTLGVGHVQVDCVAPFVLGRGGNAVTVSTQLFAEMQAKSAADELHESRGGRPRAWRPSCGAARQPLTLGMVFPFSNHNFDLRYWLAAAGVHPDRDVRLVAIPPPLMVDSLRAGLVDGFCVGEPWNSLAVAQGLGRIVATQSQLFPRAAEKVLAMRAAFAEQRGARREAAARARCCRGVGRRSGESRRARGASRAAGVSRPAAARSSRLRSAGGCGSARAPSCTIRDFLYFHRHAANAPRAADGLWAYAQMVRWGQLAPSERAERAAADVFRSDLYRQSVPGASPTWPPYRRRSIASSSRRRTCRAYLAAVRSAHAVHGRARSI